MKPKKLAKKLARWEENIVWQHKKLAKLKRKLPHKPVEDYVFAGPSGVVKLSELFGKSRDLIIVHNMGAACSYCTLWADGFNGVFPHLADRAAFVVVSPDAPAAQKRFAASRNWRFPMVSGRKAKFSEDLGFKGGKDEWWPGVSTFQKRGNKIFHVASAQLGPFDPFCSVWHFFALLAHGVDGWQPKYRYPATAKPKRARRAAPKKAAPAKAAAKPKAKIKSVSKPKAKPAPKARTKAAPKPKAKPAPKPAAKPAPKPVVKTQSKVPAAPGAPAALPVSTERPLFAPANITVPSTTPVQNNP